MFSKKGQPPKNVFRTKSATNDPIGAVESKSLKVQESLNKSQGNGKQFFDSIRLFLTALFPSKKTLSLGHISKNAYNPGTSGRTQVKRITRAWAIYLLKMTQNDLGIQRSKVRMSKVRLNNYRPHPRTQEDSKSGYHVQSLV